MRLVVAGTPANAALALEHLVGHHEIVGVLTREDAAVGRKKVMTPSPVAQSAEKLGLHIIKANRVTEAVVQEVVSLNPDLGLVIAYGGMIPKTLLDQLEFWNLHFSILPMWRGATPLQHSIMHGTKTGVSLFRLDQGLDTGDLVGTAELVLGGNESTEQALPRFTLAGLELFQRVTSEPVNYMPQQGDTSYAPKFTRQDARLSLSDSADQLHRKVLAFNPEPVAWLECGGEPIRIFETRSLGATDWTTGEHRPGRVTVSGGKVLLECANGTQLELLLIQPAGKNIMRAGDWFRGQTTEVKFV